MAFLPLQSQEDRELAQALRVQLMSDDERGRWLFREWGTVQRQAGLFSSQLPMHSPGARCFDTPAEKNAFDDARELAFAMHHSLFANARQMSPHEAARAQP